MRADLLTDPVEGIDEVLAVVAGFDQALAGGLMRPQPAQVAGLAGLADAMAASPLGAKVAEAAEKAAAGAAGEEHFISLAAARIALFGAVHDAVLARILQATGRAADDVSFRLRVAVRRRTCCWPRGPGWLIWLGPGGRGSTTTSFPVLSR